MADLTEMLAVRLADLYAGKVIKGMRAIWNSDELFLAERPAKTFMVKNPDHAFAKFLVEFEKRYTDAARGRAILESRESPDLPFIGKKVLAGEPPVVVISQRSSSPKPGSISLWAMLFSLGPAAPEEYVRTPGQKRWRSRYPQYQQVLCGNRIGSSSGLDPAGLSFGLDPDLLVVTDACLPSGCGDERAFLKEFIATLPRPRMILSLGKDAANCLNAEDVWIRLRNQQSVNRTIDPRDAIGLLSTGEPPTPVPVVVAPFVWGNNSKDRGGPHFTAAVKATRAMLA